MAPASLLSTINEQNGRTQSLVTATEPLWTVAEVADYLRLKPETVRVMARSGVLPSIKVGRNWRFKMSTIKDRLGIEAKDIE
jgi:excisionase family DNA binding protein